MILTTAIGLVIKYAYCKKDNLNRPQFLIETKSKTIKGNTNEIITQKVKNPDSNRDQSNDPLIWLIGTHEKTLGLHSYNHRFNNSQEIRVDNETN